MILPLDPDYIYEAVERALLEDLGRGDITSRSTIRTTARGAGSFLAKQDLVLAGIEVADAVFSWFDIETQIQSTANDGDEIKAGKVEVSRPGNSKTASRGKSIRPRKSRPTSQKLCFTTPR